MNLSCPNCGSNDTQSCQVIFNAGTTSHSSVARDDYGNEVKTSGSTSTNLAQMVAPPIQKDTHPILLVVLGFLALDSIAEGFFIIAGILAVATIGCYTSNKEANEYNNNVYPKELKDWQNSYYCHRCGTRFIAK